MRLFIAIDIPEDIRKNIVQFYKNVRANGKFVEYENLHITLLFLGEVENENEIIEKIKDIKYKKFYISLKGLGTFNDRVLFINVDKGRNDLIELNKILSKKFNVFEDYYPHLTILRIKEIQCKKDYYEMFKKYSDMFFGEFYVESFYLKQSILTYKGPIYKNIYEVKLE